MSLMFSMHGGSVTAAVQVPSGHNFYRTSASSPVFSGAKFDADGDVYAMSANGSWQQIGTWLIEGTNSDYYLVRSITAGTIDTDAGAGPLQLNTDREYYIEYAPLGGGRSATVTFQIENIGTDVLASGAYTFSAEGQL